MNSEYQIVLEYEPNHQSEHDCSQEYVALATFQACMDILIKRQVAGSVAFLRKDYIAPGMYRELRFYRQEG